MAKVKIKSAEERLRDFGKSVARKVLASGRAQVHHGAGATVYCVQDFLTIDECAQMIALVNRDREPSTLLAEHPDKDFRTSDSCHLDRHDPFVAAIETRICDFLGLDPRYGETMQGQVYEVGQQFKHHYDWFRKGASYWDRMQGQGGQRSWTAMLCLNQPAAGGETDFKAAQLRVPPRTGMMIVWNNMLPDGTPNDATIHAGLPVLAGTKYIVTKWFREKFWH